MKMIIMFKPCSKDLTQDYLTKAEELKKFYTNIQQVIL